MDDAALVGEMVAKAGWGVLTGGRVAGVMGAAAKGARGAGGLTIGVLPTPDTLGASPAVDVVLATGLGEARNAVIALSANACVVCGMNAATASEVALAVRAKKPVILLRADEVTSRFFRSLDGDVVRVAMSAGEAIELLRGLLMAGARQR
ncbi:MAG: hypothetical protein K0S86_5235 [Geminicoccaceae bacterium]|nr:hypothetical protein [Geminicoccaceae bacterium]